MKTMLSNRTFDALKWVAIVALPALVLFIAKIFPVWNIPYGDQIADTLAAIQFLLGALLGVSTVQYDRQQAEQHQGAYAEMVKQNNEMRDELVANLEKTYEQFGEDEDEE